jgi:hypothetical protein
MQDTMDVYLLPQRTLLLMLVPERHGIVCINFRARQ